jgi:hypothetical protein
MVGFASDPKKGLEELSGVFGNFDVATRKAVDALVIADDKTGAFNVILDALAEKSKKAAENMGIGEKATRSFINALSLEATKPKGLDGQVEDARSRLNAAINQGNSSNPVDRGFAAQDVAKLSREFETLYAAQQKVKDQQISAEFNKLSTAADSADKAIIPQIAQIEQLQAKLEELNRAKAGGATSKYGTDVDAAATQALQNQLQALKESQAEAARYNIEVANISTSWGKVGQSVALQLQAMHNALPVAQQWTEAGRMKAQYEATYLDLLNQGKTAQEAQAVASKQEELSRASAVANAQKLVQSSQDNLALVKAQSSGMEDVVSASIAYRDAVQAGATATQAAAISANMLAASYERAAQAAEQAARAQTQANQTAIDAANGTTNGIVTAAQLNAASAAGSNRKQYTSTGGSRDLNAMLLDQQRTESLGVAGAVDSAYASGGITAALQAIIKSPNTTGADPALAQLLSAKGYDLNAILGPQRSNIGDKISAYDQIVQIQNSSTSDKNVQADNLQGEVGWLSTLPGSVARDQKILDLQKSIDDLRKSTDDLNNTNGELLSPYYSQDPRTSHIGFRTQGMADGGSFIVPGGYSANDNMLVTMPLASGERVDVSRNGKSGASTNQVTIHQTFNVAPGTDVNEFGRTAYQATQSAVKQQMRVA